MGDDEKALYQAVQEQAAVVTQGLDEFQRTALKDQTQATSLLGRIRADSDGLQAKFNRLLAMQAQLTSNAFAAADASQRQVSKMLIVVSLAASVLALLVSLLLRGQILRPIREIGDHPGRHEEDDRRATGRLL
ncbi:hypothetical protein AB9U01_35850, partial [Pseudomonas qingdaonensis]